jgi:hypothetical protein
MNLVVLVAAVVMLIACAMIYPWALRHDRRVGDRRVALGKPRSAIPPWVVVVFAVAMIVGGTLLYNSH